MDESHRLKPMVTNYDQQLFLDLFKKTHQLRKSLVREINPHRFGTDSEELNSWFETKFIYAFNKYYNDERVIPNRPERLKGFIISSLQTYKLKIVKNAYLPKQALHNTLNIEEVYNEEQFISVESEASENKLMKVLTKYVKDRLSLEAYLIFNLDLNPPPYILERITSPDQKKIPKCPAEVIAEYLGIEDNVEHVRYLRKEVNNVLKQAKEYFALVNLSR